MMWAEALISSSLLLSAALLSLEAIPGETAPFLEFYSVLQMEDAAALAASQNLSAQSCAALFPEGGAFCFSCEWGDAQSAFSGGGRAYSSQGCGFPPRPKSITSISRGAWHDGRLQFLKISKFEK